MTEAYLALLLVDLHFPDAGSLKAKRKDVQSVKAQLHGRLGAAVAEVGGQDTWQRTTLSVALNGVNSLLMGGDLQIAFSREVDPNQSVCFGFKKDHSRKDSR